MKHLPNSNHLEWKFGLGLWSLEFQVTYFLEEPQILSQCSRWGGSIFPKSAQDICNGGSWTEGKAKRQETEIKYEDT